MVEKVVVKALVEAALTIDGKSAQIRAFRRRAQAAIALGGLNLSGDDVLPSGPAAHGGGVGQGSLRARHSGGRL